MILLNADESRVLGVLIEKATTTPEQYPLSLNAVTNGANQKNNRDPVRAMTEDECYDATESLRAKGLVTRVDQAGSRVSKFRHNAGEVLHARTGELAILAELLMRGPQTVGELRTRASRMSPMESLEVTQGLLTALSTRPEPLVKEIPPTPGSRAVRFIQLMCPDLHAIDSTTSTTATADLVPTLPRQATTDQGNLSDRVAVLETEVSHLREMMMALRKELGGE